MNVFLSKPLGIQIRSFNHFDGEEVLEMSPKIPTSNPLVGPSFPSASDDIFWFAEFFLIFTCCTIGYHDIARRHRARQTTRAWRREGGRRGGTRGCRARWRRRRVPSRRRRQRSAASSRGGLREGRTPPPKSSFSCTNQSNQMNQVRQELDSKSLIFTKRQLISQPLAWDR